MLNLRQIANRIRGRKKVIDKELSLQEALIFLKEMGGRGNIHYSSGRNFSVNDEASLRSMADFLSIKFPKHPNCYIDVKHEIYIGKKDERHYLDFAFGKEEGKLGTPLRRSPFRSASIDFIVERQEYIVQPQAS